MLSRTDKRLGDLLRRVDRVERLGEGSSQERRIDLHEGAWFAFNRVKRRGVRLFSKVGGILDGRRLGGFGLQSADGSLEQPNLKINS